MDKENIMYFGVGIITTFIGGWDLTMQVLLILMCVDIATGLFKAWEDETLSSKAFRKGLFGKAGFFLVLILAYQMDRLMGNVDPVIRTVACTFYIAVEGTSIIENLGAIGVPIPQVIKDHLQKLNGKNDTEDVPVIEEDLESNN